MCQTHRRALYGYPACQQMLPVLPAQLVLCPADNPWPLAPSQAHTSRVMAEQANQKQPAKFCGARLLPSPAREGGGWVQGAWGTTSRAGRTKHYRCPATTTTQCSRYIPSANVVCVHSMKLFLYTKRTSAAVRQMEGAFGRAEMSGTACVRKHARGKNKIHYCAM